MRERGNLFLRSAVGGPNRLRKKREPTKKETSPPRTQKKEKKETSKNEHPQKRIGGLAEKKRLSVGSRTGTGKRNPFWKRTQWKPSTSLDERRGKAASMEGQKGASSLSGKKIRSSEKGRAFD